MTYAAIFTRRSPIEGSGLDQLEVNADLPNLDKISDVDAPANHDSVNTARPDRPAWFKNRARKQATQSSKPPGQTKPRRTQRAKPLVKISAVPDDEDDSEISWKQKCRDWIHSRSASAYGISLLIHMLLIGILSLIFMDNLNDSGAFSTLITETEHLDTHLDSLIDAELSLAGSDAEQTQLPQLQALPVPNPLQSFNFDPQLAAVAGEGDGDQEGDGSGFVFKMPTHGKVVTKGSFTAWTEPKDPQPGQDYIIVIQIKLPERIRRYRVSDLSGLVVGTDKYRQSIPWDSNKPFNSMTTRRGKLVPIRQRQYLPLVDRQAQLLVKIPGADRLVKDTIQIRSKILKEKQTIEIEF